MADSIDAEETVFEITDYTNATDWEKFIADIERAFRFWGLGNHALPSSAEAEQAQSIQLLREYRLSLHCHGVADGPLYVNRDQERALGDDASFTMSRILSTNLDAGLPLDAHPIHRDYGLPGFVLICPSANTKRTKVSLSEAKLLLGALAIAVAESNCAIPVFTQVGYPQQDMFLGYSECNGLRTSFDMVQIPGVPPAYKHVDGIIDLFKSKAGAHSDSKIMVTAKFTYAKYNLFDHEAEDADAAPAAAKAPGYYRQHCELPRGLPVDPVKGLFLRTTWPHFREDTIVDNSSVSELEARDAPIWALSIDCYDPTLSLLGECLQGFVEACSNTTTVQSLLGDAAFVDAEEGGEAPRNVSGALDALTKPSASRALRALTRVAPLGRDISSRLASAVDKGYKSIEKKVGQTVTTIRNRNLLSDEQLDAILGKMFVDKPTEAELCAAREGDHALPRSKGAPHGGLLTLLAQYLALANRRLGGVRAFAHLWSEFVLEIRWFWDNLKPIPRLPAAAAPDLGCSLLHQKLQMINCCIAAKLERDPPTTRPPDAPAGGSAAAANNSSSDDEFFMAPEDEQGALERLERLKREFAEQPPPPEPESPALTEPATPAAPEGVFEVSDSLVLLDSREPLNIPHTQQPAPVTEDLLDEQQAQLVSFGTSEDAALMRAKFQSASLKSDMQAFKAANPGCCLADFVRWHSPRDWLCDDPAGINGHLSERMEHDDNIWQVLWKEAKPRPASRQPSLFNFAKEAEAALAYLESLAPSDIGPSLVPVLLAAAHQRLSEQDAASLPCISEKLEAFRAAASSLGHDLATDAQRYGELVAMLSDVDNLISRAQSIERELGLEYRHFLNDMLLGLESVVLKDSDRERLHELFQDRETQRLAEPTRRQFTLRATTAHPCRSSRTVGHRLHCTLSEKSFCVAGAFSTDTGLR